MKSRHVIEVVNKPIRARDDTTYRNHPIMYPIYDNKNTSFITDNCS